MCCRYSANKGTTAMIAFCIIDDTDHYANEEIQTTIRNIADHTIENLLIKQYKVFVGKDEDILLSKAWQYDHVVVMSPGTEYINGRGFFNALNELVKQDFFVAGHVLDRSSYNAYYELHHQCYVVNMAHYKRLRCPTVGALARNIQHTQLDPVRSVANFHDEHTPKTVSAGTTTRTYSNKCHGWNLLKLAFENNLPVVVFDENIRNNKKHYYPESEVDYYKEVEYIDYKFNYCKEEFIHTDNTEWSAGMYREAQQVVVPASGMLYLNLVEKGTVVFYDYNQKALDYWKEHCPRKADVTYKFVKTDLLNDFNLIDSIDPKLNTFVNLSNIFCYEGTVSKYSLKHRLLAQENLVNLLSKRIKNLRINFAHRANPNVLKIATWH